MTLLWIIPLLPLAGFMVNGLFGARLLPPKAVAFIGCGVVLLAFLLALGAVSGLGTPARLEAAAAAGLAVDAEHHRVTQTLFTWMPLSRAADGSGLTVDWAYTLDPLSAVMLLVVTGVGFLIHVYSIGYMAHEPRAAFARFFAYLNLFMAMMLTLVLGASLPVVFVGWEGVGLCSYLLIGFYYDRVFDATTGMTCADAGRKAFITNRIGDLGFVLGMLLLFAHTGTLDIQGILAQVGGLGTATCTAAALLLFLGACGKSAQIPLYVWLPDAMAGPTPVSALIHAATMVTAGVYVVSRMAPLYLAAPAAMTTVAVVGGLTALFAASIGLAQNDIKKVLAYSTVSQLGYMMLAAGVGAFGAGIFHLMTHAFFKALLFLGAGSVIHALSGEQDIRRMGGLDRHVPWTHVTFAVACMAIAGIFPLSGFFSKDEILWTAFNKSKLLWLLGATGAFLTAFYMTRLYILVFRGRERFDDKTRHHLHESPPSMTVPLVVLAVLSFVGGWVGVPGVLGGSWLPNGLERFLEPVLGAPAAGHHGAGLEIGLMAASLLIALLGGFAGWVFYEVRPEMPARFAESAHGLYRLVARKYLVDELYGKILLAPYYALCRASAWFDAWVVDGLVNAAGYVTLGTSYTSVGFDTYVVDGLVNLAGYTVRGASWVFKRFQTGIVQSYATAMVLGIFILVSVYLFWMGH
ncbi:MAG TPA: NADH-quinone oxidoreductase subunit L [Candidatus Polarisedimenticolia bacterium]|nr:NADH-quinone oxidoreductase subunit L [Candidatus Polarisedimenticolia bacterium]